jgi:prepilin-type processing-associated H-X9-DG protein
MIQDISSTRLTTNRSDKVVLSNYATGIYRFLSVHRLHAGDTAFSPVPCVGACTHITIHAAARSYHPGRVNVAFADGHVQFYRNEVDVDVWEAVATIDGYESVEDND